MKTEPLLNAVITRIVISALLSKFETLGICEDGSFVSYILVSAGSVLLVCFFRFLLRGWLEALGTIVS